MSSRAASAAPGAQRGLALLLLLLVGFFAAAALLMMSPPRPSRAREAASDAALALAKEALLAYAVTYGEFHTGKLPGYLPCPDSGARGVNAHEGSPDPPCGRKGASVVGRLPWHHLGLEPLRDAGGECLWYAVSGSFKNDPAADMLNWDSLGQLSVLEADGSAPLAGAAAEERAAAVIFAPGPPLGRQSRDASAQAPLCGGNYVADNYLDASSGVNNAAPAADPGALSQFVAAGTGGGANDRLLTITSREIFSAAQKRSDFRAKIGEHLLHLGLCIAAYGTRNRAGAGDPRLPWAAPLRLADYGSNDAYTDQTGRLAGRLPYRVALSRLATGNTMTTTELVKAGICPPPWSAQDDEWYRNWKDQIFYAVSAAYAPAASAPGACGSCLSVNGGGRYAAILIFAGSRLPGQLRSAASERADVGNYLEDRNAANQRNPVGNADYRSGAENPLFNDLLYCIDTSLRTAPCP